MQAEPQTPLAAIVLCGGKSSRMGHSKAWLPFGAEPMLNRVVRIVSQFARPVAVVQAAGQNLPELPTEIGQVTDLLPERGPLGGLQAGLTSLQHRAEYVYATSCDVPLLEPEWVRALARLVDDYDCVVPVEGEFHHPLAAIYHTRVLPELVELLAADRLRPVYLFERVRTRRVPIDELRQWDPELRSLWNLNRPVDYYRALEVAGLPRPTQLPGPFSEPPPESSQR